MKRTIIGVIAHCKDCTWMDENYHQAETLAQHHANETGHVVAVEVTRTYDAKKRQK